MALEKTEWASTRVIFLGILIDGYYHILVIPEEKRLKAINMINWILSKKSITVRSVQRVTGTLNFLNKSIIVGRTFTRRMYAKLATRDKKGNILQPYHHIKLDAELRFDCTIWKLFLEDASTTILCRPFIDLDDVSKNSQTLDFYTDSSAAEDKGFGCFFKGFWNCGIWGSDFIRQE